MTDRPFPTRRRVLAGLAALALAACAASPQVRYYRLDALAEAKPAPATRRPAEVLAVGPVILPDYLERPQFVRRGDGNQMRVDDVHRWAEPLDEAVPRVVAANVDRLTGAVTAVPASNRTVRPDYRLFVTVQRLDTDTAGHTELVVQWGITDDERAPRVPTRTDVYTARATPAQDPGAMAAATSEVIARFSQDVATALEALPER